MRNEFFLSLRPVIYNPSVGIIPMANVSLEKIHLEEDVKWLTKQEQYSSSLNHDTCSSSPHIQLRVGSRDFFIQKSVRGDHATTEDETTTTVEKLELVKVLLKQLSISFATSNLECEDSKYLSGVCTRLAKRFDAFLRNIETEARKNRLKSDTCCSFLKHSLCHLEVKFHQVERILEEIPEHIRRVIGVADFCTRQLVVSLGHDNLEEYEELAVPPEWATSIESVSKEFFKRKISLMSCFPILWKLVAKILGGSSSGNHSRRKLADFWEQVRSELEDFQKEVKVKEMDANYSLNLTIPVFQEGTEPIIGEPAEMMNNEVVTELGQEDEGEMVEHSPIAHIEINNETKRVGETNANFDNNTQLSLQLTTDDNVQNK
ncbi:hypothetical protein Ocin01_11178 [Orchesella cincta]|uniref:Uncharacterized protein n=1 Tax=Orchesella cincta TaxID=48709 RepID=A0A1D2MS08_ORCCI|nr:hypothetical protein Ocin01_11178 [Orchesella cincta]